MDDYLIEMLQCPACGGELSWKVTVRDGTAITEGEASCSGCGATYPVREGIGIFLTPDLPRNDLWEQAGSGLLRYLRERPETERRLMEGPLDDLNPADQFFRAMVLEERGEYAAARTLSRQAWERLYTPEYVACYRRQLDVVIDRLGDFTGPVVDLASGRGMLVEVLLEQLDNPIVMTDFSPAVLRRNRRMLDSIGMGKRVSLLALDARRPPFKDGSIARMTSNLGLANVEEPGDLLSALRRVVGGELLTICHFYPEDDDAHREVLQDHVLLYRNAAMERLRSAGWDVTIENDCRGAAEPTPSGDVLEGFQIDGLPVASTVLEWGILVGKPGTP